MAQRMSVAVIVFEHAVSEKSGEMRIKQILRDVNRNLSHLP